MSRRTGLSGPSPTHEASGVGLVGADLAVHLDEALLKDSSDLLAGKGILEAVAQEDREGKRLAKLVGTRRRAGSVGSAELVEEPRRGSCEALEVLLRTATLVCEMFAMWKFDGRPRQAEDNNRSGAGVWLMAPRQSGKSTSSRTRSLAASTLPSRSRDFSCPHVLRGLETRGHPASSPRSAQSRLSVQPVRAMLSSAVAIVVAVSIRLTIFS